MRPATEVWVADSSPLILLSKVGLLPLLPRMATRLVIPGAVLREINQGPADDPGRQAILDLVADGSPLVVSPILPPRMAAFGLGAGETEVLAYTWERQEAGERVFAILDDQEARTAAQALSLSMIGTAGILIRAKDDGEIESLTPYLRRLRDAGMWISDAFCRQVAQSVGETWT